MRSLLLCALVLLALPASAGAGGWTSAPLDLPFVPPESGPAVDADVAVSPSGRAVVGWIEDDRVLVSLRTAGQPFGPPTEVAASSGGDLRDVTVDARPGERPQIRWTESFSCTYLAERAPDGTWALVSGAFLGPSCPATGERPLHAWLALGDAPDGGQLALLGEGDRLVTRHRPRGGSFGEPVPVAVVEPEDRITSGVLLPQRDGTVVAAWVVRRETSEEREDYPTRHTVRSELRVAARDRDGVWGTAELVDRVEVSDDDPETPRADFLALDLSALTGGDWALAWTQVTADSGHDIHGSFTSVRGVSVGSGGRPGPVEHFGETRHVDEFGSTTWVTGRPLVTGDAVTALRAYGDQDRTWVEVFHRSAGATFAGRPVEVFEAPGPMSSEAVLDLGDDDGGAVVLEANDRTQAWSLRDGRVAGVHDLAAGGLIAAGDDGAGTAVVLTGAVNVYDSTPPAVARMAVPATAVAGRPVRLEAAGSDPWSRITLTWEPGDGASLRGSSVEHTFTEAGRRTVTLVARDGAGNETRRTATIDVQPAPPPEPRPAAPGPQAAPAAVQEPARAPAPPAAAPSTAAPRIGPLRLSRTLLGTKTVLSLSADAPGRLRVALQHRVPGRCGLRQRVCARWSTARTLDRSVTRPGTVRLSLRPLLRGRRLRPGSLRLVVTLTDAAGRRSATRSASLRRAQLIRR